MSRVLSPETAKAIAKLAQAVGANGIHINIPIICDHCKDTNKEAHPYHVHAANGRFWQHLCNECFDELGCSYQEPEPAEHESCPHCYGDGIIVNCPDDMCQGLGYCIHGDGEDLCPVCDGDGYVKWLQKEREE